MLCAWPLMPDLVTRQSNGSRDAHVDCRSKAASVRKTDIDTNGSANRTRTPPDQSRNQFLVFA